jgi:hypothetical protein
MFCGDFVVDGNRLQSEGRLFRSARSTKSLHGFASGNSASMSFARVQLMLRACQPWVGMTNGNRLFAAFADRQLALQRLIFLIDRFLCRAAFCIRIGLGALCCTWPRRSRRLIGGVIVVDGADAKTIVVDGRIRQRWRSAGRRCRHAVSRCRGVFSARAWRRRLGRSKRNRRRDRSLTSRAVLRPRGNKHEAESQERRAFHPHPSNSFGSTIDSMALRARRSWKILALTWRSKLTEMGSGNPSYRLPDGQTRPRWVNQGRHKYSHLQKFCSGVLAKSPQPATRGVSRSSRDAGRSAGGRDGVGA